MSAYKEILDRQIRWANSKRLVLVLKGGKPYAVNDDNLISPLSQEAEKEFSNGKGNELGGKMKALHSSSALVYNVFEHWRNIPLGPLEQALTSDCCAPCNLVSFEFERNFPTKLRGTAPNLDITFCGSDGSVIAVESKFTEPYCKTLERGFQDSYFRTSELWDNLPACKRLAEEINGATVSFSYLDATQLLKHILGLTQAFDSNFTLLYLWYEWPSTEADRHKKEIDLFAQRVKGEVSFCSMTYNDLHAAMMLPGKDTDYWRYLSDRYFLIP